MHTVIKIENEKGLFLLSEDRGEYFYAILSAGESTEDDYLEADYLDNFKLANDKVFTSAIDKFRHIVKCFERR